MSEAKLRVILRWIHIILGLVILCYIYSPWATFVSFQVLVKFIIVPVIVMTGIWIWKFAIFNKLLIELLLSKYNFKSPDTVKKGGDLKLEKKSSIR